MSNKLRVIDPFFVMEVGDIFTLSEITGDYIATKYEEFHRDEDKNVVSSSFGSSFSISKKYAEELIRDGFLEEVDGDNKSKNFINVFDEIVRLRKKYSDELENIDLNMAGEPECLKVEKTTVLKNMITLLDHLQTLRK